LDLLFKRTRPTDDATKNRGETLEIFFGEKLSINGLDIIRDLKPG